MGRASIRAGRRQKNVLFFPVTHADDWQAKGQYVGGLLDANLEKCFIVVFLPSFFTRMLEFDLVVIPNITDADGMGIGLQADWATEGEDFEAQTASEVYRPVVVADQMIFVNLLQDYEGAATFESLEFNAGDVIGVQIDYEAAIETIAATNAYILGIRMKWE